MKPMRIYLSYTLFLCVISFNITSKGLLNGAVKKTQESYVYLRDSLHNIAEIVVALSDWDENADSPVHKLREYICEGNEVALHNDVAQVLEYASWMLRNRSNENDSVRGKQLRYAVRAVTKALEHGFLVVNNADLEELPMLSDDSFAAGDMPTRLDVPDNITMRNSTGKGVGNITKGPLNGTQQRFINNYGIDSTFVGINAGSNFTATGTGNSGFGTGALRRVTSGNNNTAAGFEALTQNTSGSGNVALGAFALTVNTVGIDNTAIGTATLAANTLGGGNTALGRGALNANTVGSDNVAIGREALGKNTVGNSNTAVGVSSLLNSIGNNSVAIGVRALNVHPNSEGNVAIGSNAMSQNADGNGNTVIGSNALRVATIVTDTTAVGRDALIAYTGGQRNTVIGSLAGSKMTSGDNNIIIGYNAGTVVNGSSNNILIGNTGSGGQVSAIRIGSTQISCFIAGISGISVPGGLPVVINSQGQLGVSDVPPRFRSATTKIDKESACIYDLEPVAFKYNGDETAAQHYGLIAEEVEHVCPALVIRDENNEPLSVRYEMLPVLLLSEMKKQKQTTEQHSNDINLLKKTVASLQVQVQNFAKKQLLS